jgi:hypothetical protein
VSIRPAPTPIGKDEVGLLRSAQQLLLTVTASRLPGLRLVLGCGWPIWWGRRTLVPGLIDAAPLPELLAANDELAPLMLLEVSGERAPAVLRGFPSPLTKTKNSNSGAETPPVQKGKMIMERLLLSPDQVRSRWGCAGRGSMT